MTSVRLLFAAAALLLPLAPSTAHAQGSTLTQKLNAYVGCINRLSERSYSSRERYFSWAAKTGPTGKERIIYGTYTIYDTSDCKKGVEKANALEPREPELEAAASTYVEAVTTLEPLLKEADDYYTQQNYKDDKMAKGRALHSRLVAAWSAFEGADNRLRAGVDAIREKESIKDIAEIERTEGKKGRWHVETLMLRAKVLIRTFRNEVANLPKVIETLNEYEAIVKSAEEYAAANKDGKIGSSFISSAKTYLTTAKLLMRRVRDKVPYSQGDKMMIDAGSGWMIEGSPQRLMRDYNDLIERYNRGPGN